MVDQALELDRLDLGAVLLDLAAALRLLVAVELAFDAVELAVEQVDERPQEIGEIVFEAGAGQHGAQCFDRIVKLGLHGIGFGQRPGVGFVLARAIAVKGKLVEQMRGRRGGMEFRIGVGIGEAAVVRGMVGAFLAGGSAAPFAAFTAITLPAAETGCTPPWGRSRAEDGAGQLFCLALQSRADRGLPMVCVR